MSNRSVTLPSASLRTDSSPVGFRVCGWDGPFGWEQHQLLQTWRGCVQEMYLFHSSRVDCVIPAALILSHSLRIGLENLVEPVPTTLTVTLATPSPPQSPDCSRVKAAICNVLLRLGPKRRYETAVQTPKPALLLGVPKGQTKHHQHKESPDVCRRAPPQSVQEAGLRISSQGDVSHKPDRRTKIRDQGEEPQSHSFNRRTPLRLHTVKNVMWKDALV